MGDFVKVAKTTDILPGTAKSYIVENEVVAIFNVNNNFYALRDQCSHMDLPISDGIIENGVVTCAYHGAEFDIKSGDALCMPAIYPVEPFEIKIEQEDIYVSID